jgi:uncharacterized membrane protein (UPF0182 family)
MASSPSIARLLSTLRGGRLLIAAVLAIAMLVALGRLATTIYVEVLWHAQVGYADVFWRRARWEWGLRIGAGVAVGVLVFLNLHIVSKTLGAIQIKRRFGNLEISEQLPRSYVMWGMGGMSVLLAFWFGAAVPRNSGLQLLLLLNTSPWGIQDPVLQNDVGFYVFWLPVLLTMVTFALIVTFLVLTLATAGYAATGALRWGPKKLDAEDLTRIHLGALLALFMVLLGGRLYLERFWLLLDGTSAVAGIFGATDAQARLSVLQTLSIICVASGAGAMWGIWKKRAGPLFASFAAVVLGMIVIGQLYPSFVQRFRVEPNQLVSETPYIEYNLEFTRIGFGLDRLDRRSFEYDADEPVDWGVAAEQFAGLPVWGADALAVTYRELEARFPYYDFRSVAIDRYDTPSGPVPVAVSVREVEPNGIQDRNWQNLVLRERYIEGMGAVASLAAVRTAAGRPPMLLSGIPPKAPTGAREVEGLVLDHPGVFIGTRSRGYAVVTPGPEQFLAPDSTIGVAGVDFPSGISLSSRFRTALMAWRFRDWNLLFSSEISGESRLIYRRHVIDRVRTIAPFLRTPEEPYPVIAGGRVQWIIEGFTGTRAFPLSTVHDLGTFRSDVTYARNSVKVVVDGVTGQVTFYRVPIEDPLLDAYESAFPELFRPISEMPDEVRSHVRYSKQLLNLQSRVLLQYHQETAAAFHGQQDVWDRPEELAAGTQTVAYQPEYGIYALPGEVDAQFNLTTVFVPAGRQNLTAILAGRTDDMGVPELILYDVEFADGVPGPRQIEALVEQDPRISEQFSLWRTGGSEVWTGHLHLVPVGGRLLYMEPVFLAAEADAIPELRRFVVSDGTRVAMTEELSGAIAELAGLSAAAAASTVVVSADPVEVASPGEPTTNSAWPTAALDLLEQAEASARKGDWQGFGEALDELRLLLQGLDSGGR